MTIITPTTLAAWSFPADQQLSMQDVQELANGVTYCWCVETRYLGPTDTRGGRVAVSFVGSRKGSKIYPWRHALGTVENHMAAAAAWLQKLSSSNGAPAYALVSKASTDKGYVLTFC
jgi:hypothetical protein